MPPSKRGGMTVYVALSRLPRKKFKAPTVPATAEVTKDGSCQHSNIELLFEAEMAVRLRVGLVMLGDNWAVATASKARIEGRVVFI